MEENVCLFRLRVRNAKDQITISGRWYLHVVRGEVFREKLNFPSHDLTVSAIVSFYNRVLKLHRKNLLKEPRDCEETRGTELQPVSKNNPHQLVCVLPLTKEISLLLV